jgi:hypothetical protein
MLDQLLLLSLQSLALRLEPLPLDAQLITLSRQGGLLILSRALKLVLPVVQIRTSFVQFRVCPTEFLLAGFESSLPFRKLGFTTLTLLFIIGLLRPQRVRLRGNLRTLVLQALQSRTLLIGRLLGTPIELRLTLGQLAKRRLLLLLAGREFF